MTSLLPPPTRPLQRAAKRVALSIDGVLPRTPGLVVLAYHRVGRRTTSAVDLPTALFRRQMAHLAATADVVSLDDALVGLDEGRADGVVLTFDDGTADFVDIVLPILQEYRLPATLYVATSFVDRNRAFPEDGRPLSWNGVRECAASELVTVGSHTHTHALLDRADPLTAELELSVCDARLADETGVVPAHFAYPKAVPGSSHADRLVRERYRSAAVAGTRPNPPGRVDRWRLRRSPIQASDGWQGFVRKRAGGMRTEDDVRRALNRVRYRGRTS